MPSRALSVLIGEHLGTEILLHCHILYSRRGLLFTLVIGSFDWLVYHLLATVDDAVGFRDDGPMIVRRQAKRTCDGR